MRKLSSIILLFLIMFSCNQENKDTPEPTDFGYLSLNIVLSIEEVPASGRIEAVSTDDWSVTIFNASDDSEVINFTPFIDAPAEVQLPTGEYYVEAHSNNFADAAFENPYYFGRSDNFTIDKEELKSIDVNAELANSKVKINYLPSVTNTFDRYSGTVMVVGSGESLFYNETETREGYFVSAPLAVEVNLSYDKLGGGTIDRTFTTEIDAQPKTLYNINVDATLEDGKIMLNINVNETFTTEEINLGDVVALPDPDPNTVTFNSETYPFADAYIYVDGDTDPLENGANSHIGFQVGFSDAGFTLFTETNGDTYFVGTDGASIQVYIAMFSTGPGTFMPGTYQYIDQNTALPEEIEGEQVFTGGEIEFDDDGILPNGDFDGAEYSITGGTVTIVVNATEHTVMFNLETTGGPAVGHYSGPFQTYGL